MGSPTLSHDGRSRNSKTKPTIFETLTLGIRKTRKGLPETETQFALMILILSRNFLRESHCQRNSKTQAMRLYEVVLEKTAPGSRRRRIASICAADRSGTAVGDLAAAVYQRGGQRRCRDMGDPGGQLSSRRSYPMSGGLSQDRAMGEDFATLCPSTEWKGYENHVA
jgi:hypothetical protein